MASVLWSVCLTSSRNSPLCCLSEDLDFSFMLSPVELSFPKQVLDILLRLLFGLAAEGGEGFVRLGRAVFPRGKRHRHWHGVAENQGLLLRRKAGQDRLQLV